ncbi:Uncharacterized HTH-type transcriptional regulator ydcR [Cedecea neteri]|uniref:Uncharacterized HTH-type transcriptional regulator ydcR n=1 Tax=Cedecea neteri TaxID=158822 RepID=A0A2X2T8Z8_9ENTR|nr:Uncharacterized HTH-type transcriptional regulator ydcR [Cedecea neteri]
MTLRRIGISSLTRLLGHWHQASSRSPVYRQLADGLRLLILDGRLPLDSRLPGERELSGALGVSRTTVASALAQLREEGYLLSRQGSGSVTMLPESSPAISPLPGNAPVLDLSTAALSAGPEIHRAYSTALTFLPEHLSSTGYESQGLPELREAIARHYASRGLPTTPDQIMVVNGAVSGLGLILRLFTGPGDRVVVDHPTYPMALAAIRGASCRPVPVSLPASGWDVDGLAATIAQTSPRLAYLIPDFHNPTGRCMDATTRQRVNEIAPAATQRWLWMRQWQISGLTRRPLLPWPLLAPRNTPSRWAQREKFLGAGCGLADKGFGQNHQFADTNPQYLRFRDAFAGAAGCHSIVLTMRRSSCPSVEKCFANAVKPASPPCKRCSRTGKRRPRRAGCHGGWNYRSRWPQFLPPRPRAREFASAPGLGLASREPLNAFYACPLASSPRRCSWRSSGCSRYGSTWRQQEMKVYGEWYFRTRIISL